MEVGILRKFYRCSVSQSKYPGKLANSSFIKIIWELKMKSKTFTLISFVLFCTFMILSGCEEKTRRYERLDPAWFDQPVWDQIRGSSNQYNNNQYDQQLNTAQYNQAPRIKFINDKISHDFGRIGLGTKNNVCEFVFTNTGNADLVINELKTSCDCTRAVLDDGKTVYAPGESGRVLADYTDTEAGVAIKHVYLSTNDPENPRVQLSLRAELVSPVYYEPKNLELSLIGVNGNAQDIVIKSMDNKPFSITGFVSSGDCIKVDYNPNQKATQFILKPKVNMELLGRLPEGKFNIELSHPDCEVISGTYYAPPRFTISPQRLTLNNVDPSRTIVKTINITSNYGEKFELNTTFSNQSTMRVLSKQTTRNGNGYKLTVEINPPASRNGEKMFSENINLSIPGMSPYTLQCNGYYKGADNAGIYQDEECKTCGPVRVDNPGMSLHPR